ncbi:hypothetical protein X781_3000 [Mannheimia sp. USDA-ARS-USMARC-1261]|nr:hypothetical protein X781_3000 [Mannheimia sp. USDA-ARS-USMARC-1261]
MQKIGKIIPLYANVCDKFFPFVKNKPIFVEKMLVIYQFSEYLLNQFNFWKTEQ